MTLVTAQWRKRLRASSQPAYLLLADLIADDVRHGRLALRERLPTLRELAQDLALNYTTVARGYAEARKRGLIDSHPGLGTYVRAAPPGPRLGAGTGAEMTQNMPPEPDDDALLARLRDGASQALAQADVWGLLRYQDFGGTPHERAVAAGWLRPFVPAATAETVLLAPGIHSVLTALLSLLARPGEGVCVEALAYPGLKAIATQLGVQLHPLPMDADGPLPDAFEDACRTLAPSALYCNPTLHNPTTLTWAAPRREAIAQIALRHGIPLIEDDAYGMLPRQRPPALATLAPTLTYYVSGFSKCFGAGLRSAYVQAPGVRQAQRLAAALRAITLMGSPLTSALTTLWVEDGTADAMLQAVRAESGARQALARTHLGTQGLQGHVDGFHAWLPLAGGWMPVEFASYLRTRQVAVVASAAFATGGAPPDAVRICLGGAITRAQCDQALALVADTLAHPQHPHATQAAH